MFELEGKIKNDNSFHKSNISRMDDEGNSSLVYPHNVQVSTVYDPKGMLVTIKESSELKEFVITSGSEFARVGRKGMIIKLSTETLLLTFASDEVSIIDY